MDDTRKHAAQRINTAMSRIPLLIEILDELDGGVSPGDEDIRRGVHSAFASIFQCLEGIRTAPLVNPETEAEEVASEWLIGEQANRLIPSEILVGLSQEISRILPGIKERSDVRLKV